MRFYICKFYYLPIALMTGATFGCGSGTDWPATAPVSGTITYKEQPVANATVTFASQAGGRPGRGVTDAAGKFEMTTFEKNDGAVIGQHKVVVILRGPSKPPPPGHPAHMVPEGSPEETMPGDPLIPRKYFSAGTTPLTCEVKEGEDNEFGFVLMD